MLASIIEILYVHSERKQIHTGFFKLFVYICNGAVEIQLSEGGIWDPINPYDPFPIFSMTQAITWIFKATCCVQWFEVTGGFSFWWYWWNCWPPLFFFKFLFVKQIFRTCITREWPFYMWLWVMVVWGSPGCRAQTVLRK